MQELQILTDVNFKLCKMFLAKKQGTEGQMKDNKNNLEVLVTCCFPISYGS